MAWNLKGWYEGHAPGVPSTNNANEAWNRVNKVDVPSKQCLYHFLNTSRHDKVEVWPKERNRNQLLNKISI